MLEGILVNLYGSERGVDDGDEYSITQLLRKYPTYVQTIEPFTINAKDGSEFKVDPNVNLKVKDGAAPKVFRKYRKELTDVFKDACRIEINKFTTDQIVSNREAVEQAIEKRLSKLLDKEGLTSGLQYPKTIVDAKNRAIQLAQKAANEVQVAEAKKKIVNASLTPLLVRKQWIEAWDGHLPKVTGNSSTLVGLDN